MKCTLCERYYHEDNQSPACPHLELDPPTPRPGGPKLRPEVQQILDEAFNLRQRYILEAYASVSLNFAARYYADILLRRMDDQETNDQRSTSDQLQALKEED